MSSLYTTHTLTTKNNHDVKVFYATLPVAEDTHRYFADQLSSYTGTKAMLDALKPSIDIQNQNLTPVTESRYSVPVVADDEYIPRAINDLYTDIDILKTCFLVGNTNVLLCGPAGCGKSSAVRYAAAQCNLPYTSINAHRQITVEDMVGQFYPINNHFEWIDGPLTEMCKHGGVLVVEEINGAPPEIMFVLHRVLDKNRELVLLQNHGDIIPVHPNFHLVASMNPGYGGTMQLNEALNNRFHIKLNYDFDAVIEQKLIEQLVPKGIDLSWLLPLFNKVREEIEANYLSSTVVSTRSLVQFITNMKLFGMKTALYLFVESLDASIRKGVSLYIHANVTIHHLSEFA